MDDSEVPYRRVLLKLSGEALMGELDYGIEPRTIKRIAGEIATAQKRGVEIAVVVGGGNIFRGAGLAGAGMDQHQQPCINKIVKLKKDKQRKYTKT